MKINGATLARQSDYGSEVSTSELPKQRTGRPEDIKAVPVRHPGRWVAAAIVLVVAASIVRSVVTNPNFQWDVVGHYLFDPGSSTAS